MKIAIDLNDVVRDYSNNFLRLYIENYNHEYDLTDFDFWSHNMDEMFPFANDNAYYNFMYNDFAFELYGKCKACSRGLEAALNTWTEQTLKDLDTDEDIEVIFVSTKEYGLSIGNTYFFISKIGTKIREVYMPTDSTTVWDKCDVLITANPDLLACKPDGKKSIKIEMPYNNDSDADATYPSLDSFLSKAENTTSLLNGAS